MKLILIKIIGFLIGLFTILTILSYLKNKKIIENFKNDNVQLIENFSNSDDNNFALLPHINKKFISISTFKNNISMNDQKWYDDDIDENNNYLYFKFNNLLNSIPNSNNQGANSLSIKNVSLKGPYAFNFANNDKYELTNCSIFFTLKINDIKDDNKNNILFEMLADTNTSVDGIYVPVSISIIFINNFNNTYTINIIVGNIVYTNSDLTNINKKTLTDIDVNLIGLLISKTEITFIINNNTYNFQNKFDDDIVLGTNHIVINKHGNIDANLFNFIYYKYTFLLDDIPLLKSYNNYYISGLYVANEMMKDKDDKINQILKEKEEASNKVKKLQQDIDLLSNMKSEPKEPIIYFKNEPSINKCPAYIPTENKNKISINPIIIDKKDVNDLKKILTDNYEKYFKNFNFNVNEEKKDDEEEESDEDDDHEEENKKKE